MLSADEISTNEGLYITAAELNNKDGCPNKSQPPHRVINNYPLTGRTGKPKARLL